VGQIPRSIERISSARTNPYPFAPYHNPNHINADFLRLSFVRRLSPQRRVNTAKLQNHK